MNSVIHKALILLFVTACSSEDFGCKDVPCFSDEFCRMVAVDCTAEPCPELPMCVSSATTCVGTTPYIDSRGAIVSCVDSSQCNAGFNCLGGYCCDVVAGPAPSQSPEMNKSQDSNEVVDNLPPPIFNNDLFGSNEKKDDGPTDIPCKPCDMSICFTAVCPLYPDAKCIEDNCTCEAWFEDVNRTTVACFPEPDLPFPFDDEKTTVIPSTTMTGTSHSVHEDAPWVYALYAVGAVTIVCIIAVLLYKLHTGVIQKRKNDLTGKDAEKKASLSKTSSENNNELKPLNPLVNGQSTTSEDV